LGPHVFIPLCNSQRMLITLIFLSVTLQKDRDTKSYKTDIPGQVIISGLSYQIFWERLIGWWSRSKEPIIRYLPADKETFLFYNILKIYFQH
jgi:hypothetical protein